MTQMSNLSVTGSLNSPITSDAQLSSFVKAEKNDHKSNGFKLTRRTSDFWMDGITHGVSPFAPSDYQFYRNVMDYGATGDGSTDDTAAINRAISDGNRCGENCGSTSVLGALVYFPAGTYVVSTPIIQYYYSQFVGDPNDRPIIKGSENFTGIALIDTDPYIPGGNGDQWYINQNQFYRQIRNFEFDLTAMNWTNYDDGQEYVPTGLHWQVAQATSLQNLKFTMPVSTSTETTTAVGIFMENGSGGFLSNLEFVGGNIGFRAGTQQYTARDLTFTSCLTGISMIWDWGFTWKNLNLQSVWVAFDCTSIGGTDDQGTGSISVLGMYLTALLPQAQKGTSGEIYITSWAYGRRYTSLNGNGTSTYGLLDPAPQKPESLLDPDGEYFVKSRPQYESYSASDFVVATANGVKNDATGDQSSAINKLLSDNVGSPIFFPAGIYQVQSTVEVPVGSIIVGEGWSQIMSTGSYFEDELSPQVMVKVGSIGDSGIIQISDMLFTVKGPTAGAVLMEWNVHESTQGSGDIVAAMWDSHFRVGGANGTDLQTGDCPKLSGSVNKDCMAASMLLHVTSTASGYFENIWAWVADHDLDAGSGNSTTTTATQIDIYVGRGVLIESQGPVWFYGCASEHSILYQYQLSGAKDIFMGHIQTETPYFQATPDATSPYTIGTFDSDPTFEDCTSGSSCAEAWALQVLNSEDNYDQSCLVDSEDCQQALVQTSYTQGLWLYNLFTIGATEMITPAGGVIPPTYQSDNDE
ncbi:pectin lyase-like protein [Penicillium herquei]|nr:pectin lyase-like protein [Penicillium herquei]